MSLWLSGIGVSRGIAIARVQKMHGGDLEVPEYTLPEVEIEQEVSRFYGAQRKARDQLRAVRQQIPGGTPGEIAAFIDTHLLMMEDRSLTEAVVALIREHSINAEAALRRQRDALVAVFEQMDDPYLRTRKDDVDHVVARIQRILLKSERQIAPKTEGAEPFIMVSDDITPADIILLSQQNVAAFITEYGGPLSHTAILARSLGIPAIVGLRDARKLLRENETVIVDGEAGHVLADPDAKALDFYLRKQEHQAQYRRDLVKLKGKAAISQDGIKIHLLANIELLEDAAEAVANGAEGIGLYRTEFLYMNRKGLPSEEEQYEAYSRIVAAVQGPITIRTLDLGADKQVDSGRSNGPTPNNPALGLRAIRLCLKEPELFRVQVRALLRASAHGKVQIMLPMISNLQELRQSQQIIESSREELRNEGYKVADEVPIGTMIEVPAAAIAAPMLARHSRFFSIGTNDLIQYTLAIDRVDDEVNYLYDPLHPAVLRLIHMTIEAGIQAGIPVAMCGEMAGDPRYTRLLLGLGLTEFSMHPANVLEIKRIIIESNIGELKRKVKQLLTSLDPVEMRDLIDGLDA
ncbi:phosphoenolpyruvate--protein phosphotransferase [Stenotrophobium rhamnosiphilum]|uniref:Phosphoenolpyruvate-protein phosphotransferase n=1 Tax=Stenotrophobium rhamnosiphilum TaxID=2029166 RepID=A0A2T5MBT8_9GAMM|nr:phosphoenolpyruvate--protein phosphotransferase [Stenotrophobium rhamnosiphilum]PTU30043.1 phosphoenolpyruvate--protein phosphotransferase [Stenotrophobium rhamnosiphilum]